jgi:hypothetical protein
MELVDLHVQCNTTFHMELVDLHVQCNTTFHMELVDLHAQCNTTFHTRWLKNGNSWHPKDGISFRPEALLCDR